MAVESEKTIKVKIQTIKKQEGQIETYQEELIGSFAQVANNAYIRYQEQDGSRVTMRVSQENEVQLSRSNDDLRLRMVFLDDKEVQNAYRTPYGVIPLTTNTSRLDVIVDDEEVKGEFKIDYMLSSGENMVGEYKIRLQFSAI